MPRHGLPGYTPLRNSARQYSDPSGRTISRYEYDSKRLQAAGWRNRGELERARRSQAWEGVKKWEDRLPGGNPAQSAFAIALQPHAHDAYEVEVRRRDLTPNVLGNIDDNDDLRLVAADGPLARLLVAMGIRDASWKWAVGETPTGTSMIR